MLGISPEIWNNLAKEQPLLTEWGKRVLPLSAERMQEEMAAEAKELKADGEPPSVILALQTVRPLLLEQEAIFGFIPDHPELKGFLPEVYTVDEALHLAVREFFLSRAEVSRLRKLLTNLVVEQMPE